MKKIFFFLAAAIVVFAGCKKAGGSDSGGNGGGNNVAPARRTVMPANCIVVSDTKTYAIDATIRGNGVLPEGIGEQEKISLNLSSTPEKAALIWESEAGWITSLSYDTANNCVEFSTKGTPGNALIAATTEWNVILWSWHIWNPGTGVEPGDVNLGATATDYEEPGVMGLLYQWGRKEPFPAGVKREYTGSDTAPFTVTPLYGPDGNEVSWTLPYRAKYTIECTLGGAVQNPTMYLNSDVFDMTTSAARGTGDYLDGADGNDDLWGSKSGKKTMFDPCPDGYRIGKMSDFDVKELNYLFSHWQSEDDYGDHLWKNGGWEFSASGVQTIYMPAAGRYDGLTGKYSAIEKVDSYYMMTGYYWLSDVTAERKSRAVVFDEGRLHKSLTEIDWETFQPFSAFTIPSPRSEGYSIRCMKEK